MRPIKHLLTNFIEKLIFKVKIEGESAWPELIPQKIYWATNLFKPKINDFIIFENPKNQKEIFVKKIKEIKNNNYFVKGAVSWSSSSKDFGLINRNLVLGKILKND